MQSPANPSTPPPFYFREEDLFRRDRERLVAHGEVSEQDIDAHVFAIQDAIVNDPFREPQSRPLPGETPGTRTAVSEPTPYAPVALIIVYRVEGSAIRLWRVRERYG